MSHDYLMNIATIMFFICYIPELYANYKNKNANIYNIPEKILVLSGSSFAFAYALLTNDIVLVSNYGPLLTLDIIAFLMRAYYVYKNNSTQGYIEPCVENNLPKDIEVKVTI
jgi:uncharacterized protein with PQ loop repeat